MARSNFVGKPVQKKLNKQNYVEKVDKAVRATGARPSLTAENLEEIVNGAMGEGMGVPDAGGLVFMASDENNPILVEWRNIHDQARVGWISSFQTADQTVSGIVLSGQKDPDAGNALVYLNVYDDDGTTILTQFKIDADQECELVQYVNNSPVTRRSSPLPAAGWQPQAWTDIFLVTGATGNTTLAANGGACATPIRLTAPMLLDNVTVRQGATGSARTWNWYIYLQTTNTGDSAENTLNLVAYGEAAQSFTPGAISNQTITATSAPVYLPPGLYWCVIQNQHATNTFLLRNEAVTSIGINSAQTKTLTNPLGGTLDFVAATWTKVTDWHYVFMKGRVFGETAAW